MADGEPNFLGLFGREPKTVALKAGEVLFKKGDDAQSMYVVLSGEITVGEANVIFDRLEPGSIVGEMALIDGGPRSATVTASQDAMLAEIDEKRLLFLVQQTPMFALNLMRLMSQRLRKMNQLAGS
jgi:CRP/FNR family cyclic AMP-dependent transcriptional regulator